MHFEGSKRFHCQAAGRDPEIPGPLTRDRIGQYILEICRYTVDRLSADFRLAIISLFAVCSVSTLLPFSIYRFLAGDLAQGFIDLAAVSTFVALVVYAWQSGRSILAGTLTGVAATVAVMAATLVLGLSPYWIFAALTANFLMAERRFAMLASAVMIASTGMHGALFADGLEQASYIAVAIMISLFNLIFASRVDSQHRELSNIASRDPLTGALNRRAMNMDLATIINRYRKNPCDMGIAMIDLDNFKRLNDLYGHDTGDRILVEMVGIINRHIRCSDCFYRFGGEEFVLLLPGAGLRGLRVALNNVKKAIGSELRGPDGPVTVSIGGAVLENGEDWPHWLARADEALLNAKRAGRDRIRISHATDLAPLGSRAATTTMPAAG